MTKGKAYCKNIKEKDWQKKRDWGVRCREGDEEPSASKGKEEKK